MLRKHQMDMQRIARKIRSNGETKNILVDVTPGGGKSALPMILAKELAEPMGYKICWVVPRDALRAQGEHDFVNPGKRALFGHKSTIRASGNEIRPARDSIGYITTYHSIAQDPTLHAEVFKTDKYILVLDECHHVPHKGQGDDTEKAWYEAIRPLVELAHIRIFASGTLERHDGNFVAFIPYKRNANSYIVDWSEREGWDFIRYSRKDALEERAINPIHFHVMDGRATWLDPLNGETRKVESMAKTPLKDQPSVLKTILETEYAYQLMDKCVTNWKAYKQQTYPKAKMLVVAPGITVANDYCKYLQRQGLNALIATSDKPEEARNNIRNYKAGKVDILVTVGMAYEGLDVPQITHVACLTNIRSKSWIEQCICRANRTDPGKTHGYVFCPDEPRLKEIIDEIAREQAAAVFNNPLNPPMPKMRDAQKSIVQPVPQSSIATNGRGYGLEDGTQTDYNETAAIENAMVAAKIVGASVIQFKQAMVALGVAIVPSTPMNTPDYTENVLTPSESEKRLKKSITEAIHRAAKGDVETIKDIQRQIYRTFGERDTMSIATMQLVLRWLQDTYGGVM